MAAIKTSKNAALNLYDQKFKVEPRNQFEIEMKMFAKERSEEIGGLGKAEHFKNVLRMAWPWIYPDNWHDWNELMLWAWCNYTDISAAGAGSSHKTFTFSLLSGMEFFASPTNTAVIMTSTTVPALKTRLWPRFKDFHNKVFFADGKGGYVQARMPYHIQESKTMIQLTPGDDEHSIRAVAIDKGNTEKALGKIIGNHPGRVVMVIDEAAQTEQAAFDAKTNLSIGTSFFRFVRIANPISRFDSHGKGCEPRNGWSTVSANDEWWETKTGICLHFNGLKSPNVLLGKRRYPKLISLEDIDAIRKDPDAGENSATWYSQVLGFWAPAGLSKTVLDIAIIDSGHARDKAVWATGFRMIATLDPAFTTGGDKCVLRFFRVGKMIDGVVGMEFADRINIILDASGKVPINYQIADRCRDECVQRQVKPEDFSYDATSASGLGDIISQRWSPLIRRISFGGKASESAVGFGDERRSCDVYGNKVTELWYTMKRAVQAGRIRGLDDIAAAEFCTRETEMRGEKTWVESKRDMKERTKGTSPDDADPCAMAVCHFRDICEQELGEIPGGTDSHEDWQRLQRRYNAIHSMANTYQAA